MTRMWMVNPEKMCQQHRLGEHKEIHDLVGFIKNGHISKVIFHAARGQVFPKQIVERHGELERYDDLTSRISVPDVVEDLQMAGLSTSLIDHNERELAKRCDDCAKRMGRQL